MVSSNPENVAIRALPTIAVAIAAPQLKPIGIAQPQIKRVSSAEMELLRHLKSATTGRSPRTVATAVEAIAA
jgi:hypothetical protein